MSIQHYTIELRTNFSDRDKDPEIQRAVAQAARHLQALVLLIHDGIEPEIVAYSDDWLADKKEISLLDDLMGQTGETVTTDQGEEISAELIEALQSMKGRK